MRISSIGVYLALIATTFASPTSKAFLNFDDPTPTLSELTTRTQPAITRSRRFSIDEHGHKHYITTVSFVYADGTVATKDFDSYDSDSDSDDGEYVDSRFEATDPDRSILASLQNAILYKLYSIKTMFWKSDDLAKPALMQRIRCGVYDNCIGWMNSMNEKASKAIWTKQG